MPTITLYENKYLDVLKGFRYLMIKRLEFVLSIQFFLIKPFVVSRVIWIKPFRIHITLYGSSPIEQFPLLSEKYQF